MRDLPLRPGKLGFQLRQLRARLHNAGLGFRDRRLLALVCGFSLLEILFGDQALLEQFLSTLVILVVAFEIRLRVFQRCLQRADVVVSRLVAGLAGGCIRFGGTQGCLLGLDIGLGLRLVDAGHQLTFLDDVAFLDQDVRQLARELGAQVDVITRLDLTRRCDHSGQVFAHHFAGLHGDNAAAVVRDARHHAGGDQKQDKDTDQNLPLGLQGLQCSDVKCVQVD